MPSAGRAAVCIAAHSGLDCLAPNDSRRMGTLPSLERIDGCERGTALILSMVSAIKLVRPAADLHAAWRSQSLRAPAAGVASLAASCVPHWIAHQFSRLSDAIRAAGRSGAIAVRDQ